MVVRFPEKINTIDEPTPEQQAVLDSLIDPDAEPTSKPQYQDDKPQHQAIVSMLLHDPQVFEQAIKQNIIDDAYFVDKAHQFLVKTAIRFFREFGYTAPLYHFDTAIRHEVPTEAQQFYLGELQTCINIKPAEHEHNWKYIAEFDRQQRMRLAIKQSIDLMQKNPVKWDEVRSTFEDVWKPRVMHTGKLLLSAKEVLAASKGYDWIIEDCLYAGSINLLSAKWGSGKSVLLQQIAGDIIFAEPVFGKATRSCPQLYLDWDAGDEHFRDWLRVALKHRDEDHFAKHFFYASNSPDYDWQVPLPASITTGFLDNLVAGFDRPGVIYVDAFRNAFCRTEGLSHNWLTDAAAITKLVDPFRAWAHRTKWALMWVHHDTKMGVISASEALGACSDVIWKYERDEGQSESTLKISKRIPKSQHFVLQLREDTRHIECIGAKMPDVGTEDHKNAMGEAVIKVLQSGPQSQTKAIQAVRVVHEDFGRNELRQIFDSFTEAGIVEHTGSGASSRVNLSADYENLFFAWQTRNENPSFAEGGKC